MGVQNGTMLRLLSCFRDSFINSHGELIAHLKSNTYLNLFSCEDELDLACKVLEWLSRSACKTECFNQRKKNNEFHEFMLNGINRFLKTTFTNIDMELIYTRLGNKVNRTLTERFVISNYDMKILEVKE